VAFLEKNCPINKVYIVSHDSDQFADFEEVPINSDFKIVYSKRENELPLMTFKIEQDQPCMNRFEGSPEIENLFEISPKNCTKDLV
jgi:hypothetical protein